MSFNLNRPVDFARVTNSLGSSVALQVADVIDRLSGRTKWSLKEASYDGARFHVIVSANQDNQTFQAALSSVTDQGGRRKAIFRFPYVDGQTTEDLGREGYTFSFDAIFHGPNYQIGWQTLLQKFDSPLPKQLIHPVLGSITAVPKSWSFTHQADMYQAIILKLEFIEHNFSLTKIGDENRFQSTSFRGAVAKSLAFFAKVESAINTVGATVGLVTSVREQLLQGLAEIENSFRLILSRTNVSFGGGSSDIPGALPVSQGGTVTGTGAQADTQNVLFPSVDDPYVGAQITTSVASVALTPSQAIDEVNTYRAQVNRTLELISSNRLNLQLYQEVIDLKQSVVDLQAVVEAGIQTSRPKIVDYTLPYAMSLREVAFRNGLGPDRAIDLDQLNPFLDSTNEIPKGTMLQVPTS